MRTLTAMSHPLRVCLLVLTGLTTACASPATTSDAGTGDTATTGQTSSATGPTTAPDETSTTTTDAPTTTATADTGNASQTGETDDTGDTGATGIVTSVTSDTGDSSTGGEPLPCPKDGGIFCGGNGVGGDPTILYICQGDQLEVLEDCGEMCSYMPLGTPDQCPSEIDVPASLLDLLGAKPYVEQDCTPTTYEGWPYDALECTYTVQGVTATVKTATPPPARVGAWIVDAAAYIPALAELKATDPGAYEEGLGAIGLHMLYQSSRIFPLTGDIVEDLGNGAEKFPFNDGVSDPCGSGCYCRINSLHRTEWCGYQESLGESYDACIAAVGDKNHTPEWAAHCLGNHITAWNSDANDHFRAKAYLANKSVSADCPPAACTPAQVVGAVKSAYGL